MKPQTRTLTSLSTAFLALTLAIALSLPSPVAAQSVAGTIVSPAGAIWNLMSLYKAGNKLYIADKNNYQILVYDATTLDYLRTISLASYFTGRIMDMAFHEGAGMLYVSGNETLASGNRVLVFIDADTDTATGSNASLGWSVKLVMDEARGRLYAMGNVTFDGLTLFAIDVDTNTVVDSLMLEDLEGYPAYYSDARIGQRHLNPVTGELFICSPLYGWFIIVDGPTLDAALISNAQSQGWEGTWNPQENKLYITTAGWTGYFIHDRDTSASTVAASMNDGTQLFYSTETNRVYSGAEINGDSTVIEGATDAWQNVEVSSGHLEVAFMNHNRRAYFANPRSAVILSEDTLTTVTTIPFYEPTAGGVINTEVIVDQGSGRAYFLNTWSSPSQASCMVAIDDPPAVIQEDLLATWDGQGVYYRNSDSGGWVRLASPATMLTCGDIDEDGIDDLLGLWPTQGGIWVRYSQSGSWARLSSTAVHIASGDMNGDGRDDLLGTWDGQGVYYRDSETGAWVKMASPASLITTGDIDGDETDDLIGIWPSQGGVWVKYSQSGAWARLSSTATDIAAGDMNGDGRDDLLATWDGQGVFYRDSVTGAWVKMASEATQVTCGDLDADGTKDLLGIWPGQGGVWVKYSDSGAWARISSTAQDISAGVMRLDVGAMIASLEGSLESPQPVGGLEEGPDFRTFTFDQSEAVLDQARLSSRAVQKNLTPRSKVLRGRRIPGPGESGFKAAEQKNQIPGEKKTVERRRFPILK